jgi:hypothetical protein
LLSLAAAVVDSMVLAVAVLAASLPGLTHCRQGRTPLPSVMAALDQHRQLLKAITAQIHRLMVTWRLVAVAAAPHQLRVALVHPVAPVAAVGKILLAQMVAVRQPVKVT